MTATRSYAFAPKGAPGETSLVLVVAEASRDIGKADALAKKLGFKSMRAADDALVQKTLGVDKKDATPLLIKSEAATKVFVVLSSSLTAADSLAFTDDHSVPASALTQHLSSHGIASKEVDFPERGAAPAPVPAAAAPTPIAKAATSSQTPSRAPEAAQKDQRDDASNEGITVLKDEDFSEWYSQVVRKAELIDYYNVSGCYILRPASYFVWGQIQAFFDAEIRKLGVDNCYFPMFVSSKVLEREKDHIEGFAPEVAWVTRAGQNDLEEPIAIRPTSETVMYPYYAKWIRSHRDLPLKLNQWNSVVRWEFKTPQPFLRTREFLWQEGHTAHLTKPEADTEVRQILDLYRRVYEDLLAVPVVPGVKSEKEKFAGGLYTTTVEGFVPNVGRGIQGGTSHCLGQNFSKMFNIVVEDPAAPVGTTADKLHVWQDSWGLSTRTIGVMVMVHGDDKGLVFPPRVAQVQCIVIPTGVTAKTSDDERARIEAGVDRVVTDLTAAGVKAKSDKSYRTPGFKYAHWEVRGVPLRVEVGPKDLAKDSVRVVRRDTGAATDLPLADLGAQVYALMETMHRDMFAKAKAAYDSRLKTIRDWADFVPWLNEKGVCVIPWCETEACEDDIKARSAKETEELLKSAPQDERAPSAGAKSLCIPFDQERWGPLGEGAKCTGCGAPAKQWTMFGRSY